MNGIQIKNIEGEEISIELIKNEMKEMRDSGKRKVEEKIIKNYIKTGIVQVKDEKNEWIDLEVDNKDKLNEIIELFKNLDENKEKKPKKAEKTEKTEKPKKTKKAKENEENQEKKEKKTKKTKKIEEPEEQQEQQEQQPQKVNEFKCISEKHIKSVQKEIKELIEMVKEMIKNEEMNIGEIYNDMRYMFEYIKECEKQYKEMAISIKQREEKKKEKGIFDLNDLKIEKYESSQEKSEIDREIFGDLNEMEDDIIELTE